MDEQDEALSARAQSRIGTTLRGKYRLDRVLGIGGMATVFAATHRNQAELAVKILHPELSLRVDLMKRFLREGYVGNSVKHPGAVLVVDDDVAEDGSAFLVMELLRGRSLEELSERGGKRLSSRAVTSLALQLLDVLTAAHEKAIVHRDLKPANLFLTVDGTLKVLDFGIARLRDAVGTGGDHTTRTGTLMGTPAFMAPEQAQAIAPEIDAQTDIWAVGATMYTLLSGQLVHDGDNSSQLLIRAGTSRARPLLSVAPDIEPAVAAVVDRALAFEKTGRWPSAEAMHDGLVTAAVAAFGQVPGRDVLAALIEADPLTSRGQGAPGSRSSGVGSGVRSPRLVISGPREVGGNDPTFATPVLAVSAPPPGMSTAANPVSAEASLSRKSRSGLYLSIVTVVALAVAVVAVGFALTRPQTSPTIAAATASAVSSSSAPPVPPSTQPAVAVAPSAPLPDVPAISAIPTASSPVTKPATKAATARPTSTKVDCSTPYTFEANGDKKWKPECL
jgi:eukaryotic-like serine/threonine-protein kinase